ncbi:uncharacterized protein LOC115771014 [Drosophila novamexicana]|uniref:uncharacterized protein LOC115771014 n=1 Tax=Drosophila novamexicana TaxID=47314 RepID=UPI0011E59966|nr:uncharacterized protein LOC115771014 [Drosophila novamexicana]
MPPTKIQSNPNEQSAAKRSPLYVSLELRNLIEELMMPRIEMLRIVVSTRFVSEAQNVDDNETEADWWPDYSIYSHLHYMTEMNGLMHLTQNALKGMTEELKLIGVKFQAFVVDHFKARQSAWEDEETQPPDDKQLLGRYLLAQSLIKDMVTFVNCCSRHCNKLLAQRTIYSERAAETKGTEDRICLKIFDERSFTQLHGRMSSLKGFVQDFCDLFDSERQPSVVAAEQNATAVAPASIIST